jgi:hypothetical protein
MSINPIDWVKWLLGYAGTFVSGFFVGKLREQKKQKDREIENLKDENTRLHNRPRTDDDALQRLLNAANEARKP